MPTSGLARRARRWTAATRAIDVNSQTRGFGRKRTVAGPSKTAAPKLSAPPPAGPPLAAEEHLVLAQVVDLYTKKPLGDMEWEVLDPRGERIAEGTTDWRGTVEVAVPAPGEYRVRVLGPADPGDVVLAVIFDVYAKKPIAGAKCEIVDAAGKPLGTATSDADGIIEVDAPAPGEYVVRVVEVPPEKK
jgi:hypothetical protein